MTRIECENQILEKLKEIGEIVKEYDKSDEIHLSMYLSMCIIDGDDTNDYRSLYSSNKEFPLDVAFIEGEVCHFGN